MRALRWRETKINYQKIITMVHSDCHCVDCVESTGSVEGPPNQREEQRSCKIEENARRTRLVRVSGKQSFNACQEQRHRQALLCAQLEAEGGRREAELLSVRRF